MKGFFRRILLSTAALLALGAARADEASFEINTPLIVTAGEMFRVEFVLEGKADDDTFRAPEFDGLDVLAGPTAATGYQYQNINGVSSQKTTLTITYVVMARNAGTVTIGAASIDAKGRTYTTKATPIEVVDEGAAERREGEDRAAEQGNAVKNKVAKDDILLRLNLSRASVYKGEPLRASLTLYTRVGIAGFENVKLPSFNGFWSQELPTDNYTTNRQTLDGKVYDTRIIKEYLLYPQQAGTLTIDPAEMTAIAQVVIRNNNGFDPFFGSGADVYNVQRKLSTGRIEANSAATYTVKISGTGNLTFLQAPALDLPTSFELYDVRSTEALRTTAAGTTGYRQFEYPFIARAEGEYEIPPVEFSYFNPEKESYATLSTRPLTLRVAPDASGGSGPAQVVQGPAKEDVRRLGNDIRFIKSGRPALRSTSAPLMFSATYFVSLLLIAAAFVALYFALRRMIRDSKNTVLVRNRRANKVAVQRFRAAERFMREQNRHAFYEEMLRALWGYMSDKLNIPVADLTKEKIRDELQRRGVTSEEARRFTEIISRCDEAQYSPSASVGMNEVYAEGVNIISHIESIVKR